MTRDMWQVLSGPHSATCQAVSKSNNENSSGTHVDIWQPVTAQKYPRIFIIKKILYILGIIGPTWVFFWELLDEYRLNDY